MNASLREDFMDSADVFRSGNFGGSSGGSTSGSAAVLAQNSCIPSIVSPDRVEWNGDDCDNFSIDIPAAEKVLHYKELLNTDVMNGIYYAHSEAVSRQDICNKVLAREPGWTMRTAMLANMFPMLTDTEGNTFYVVSEKSNLFKAIAHMDVWGKDAVFIAFDRTKNEDWTRGEGYAERMRAMLVPHADERQRQYAGDVWDRPSGFNRPPRRQASVNWDEMMNTSRDWTGKYAGAETAAKLKWYEEGGDYGIVAHTFYDTMRAIERNSIAKKKKYPHSFVFLIAGQPQTIIGVVLKIVSGIASTVVLAFTGISIPPSAIEGLLTAIVAFAEGRGGIDTLLLAAIDVAVTIAMGSGKDGKPLFGETTRQIIGEAFKAARIIISNPKDPVKIALAIANGLGTLSQKGILPNPLRDIRTLDGKPIPLMDAVTNFGFEQIRVRIGTDIEQSSQYLSNLVKSSTDFRMSMNQALVAIKIGGESVEKAFNAAVDRVGRIVESGGTSILDDTLIRNSFLTAINGGTLSTGATLSNVAAAVMNIPDLRQANADSVEAIQSFAGLAAGFGFNPRVFDQMQFNGLIKGAEEAIKKGLPFSLPSQLMSAFPDKADDYRIKLEKCYNVSLSETTNRATQVPVPDNFPDDGAGAGGGAQLTTPEAAPPPNSTTSPNGIVTNPQGVIIGNMLPNGQFSPIGTPQSATSGSRPNANSGASGALMAIPNFANNAWFPPTTKYKLPEGIRSFGGMTVACFKRVKIKRPEDDKPKNAMACIPFLGDGEKIFTNQQKAVLTDYFIKYLPDGRPRTGQGMQGLYGLGDSVQTGNNPIGVQIACVAEAMLKENVSEAALRQFYDNLPNERMTSRTTRTFGDEGVVHFEKYSRQQLLNSNDLAPLEELQRDYAGIFVWSVVEDAGRNCFSGWPTRGFIRNARILDVDGKPMSGFFTLNDGWKSLAEGGLQLGSIFVRLMPNGTPHTGIVVKKDGDFFETIEANALANSGRGTSAAIQRFRMATTEAVDWKFLNVWDDSSVTGIKSPVTGRCCVVPSPNQDSPVIARPLPTQVVPFGTIGGWIPTDEAERRDGFLRSQRTGVFTYHEPQIFQSEAGVFWKSVRNVVNSSLLPTKVPLEIRQRGYELNPNPMGEIEQGYEYLPEGIIARAYRKRVFTSADMPAYIKRKLAAAKARKDREKRVQQRGGSRSGAGFRGGLRDELSDSASDMANAIKCSAEKLLAEMPSANQVRSRYGADFHFNQYEPLDRNASIAATQEDYCAMFVWLVWSNAYNCMGGNINISAKQQRGQNCLYKNSRVKDSNGTSQPGQSLYNGSTCPRGNEPKVGAVFIANRQSGAGGHTGVVVQVNANGSFETIEGNGTRKPVARYSYANPSAANIIGFLYPFEAGCAPQNAQPRTGAYCCPQEQVRGCTTCTGGGVKQPDGSCRCPQGTSPDPQNPCNCKPQSVTTGVCAEAQPAPDGDCRQDAQGVWQRAAQGEPRNAAYKYSPQGCWKCLKIQNTTETCNEPEPPRDPECTGIWISRTSIHQYDPVRNKYVGSCWYCERNRTTERNPQCPPTVPSGFGTGWENVPAGASCNDTANYNYFKTSTGLCCFRKPKNPQTPPPRVTTPPPSSFVPPEPPSYTPPPPQTSGTCRACQENEDIIETHDKAYTDWEELSVFPAHYSEENQMWMANIYGRLIPYKGQDLEFEEIEGITPANVTVQTLPVQTAAARTAAGEPGAIDALKQTVLDLSAKLDQTALTSSSLDTKIQAAIQAAMQDVKQTLQTSNVSAWDKGVVDARMNEVSAKLQNFDAVQMQSKMDALQGAVGKVTTVIEDLPKLIAQAQASGAASVSPSAVANASVLAAANAADAAIATIAPPNAPASVQQKAFSAAQSVLQASSNAAQAAAGALPPFSPPEIVAKAIAEASAQGAQQAVNALPPNSPERKAAQAVAQSIMQSVPQAAQAEANANTVSTPQVASKADVQAIAKDVAAMQALITNSKTADCVGQLVKSLNSAINKIEAVGLTTENRKDAEKIQAALAPLAVKMDEMRREFVQTQSSTAQAASQAASQAAQAAAASAQVKVSAEAEQTITALAKDVMAALGTQKTAQTDVKQQNQLNLIQKLVEDVAARADAGANVDALAKPLVALAQALASGTALQPAQQSLVATMQSVPVPAQAIAANYNGYNDQIALLRNELEQCNQQIFLATAKRNEAARRQAMLNYYNTMSLYQQQCNVCPSCPNAVGFF